MSSEQRSSFESRGFVRVRSAFDPAVAAELSDVMWRELEESFGILREDRATWRQPERDLKWAKTAPAQSKMSSARLLGAVRELLDDDGWGPPAHWGRVLVTFPEPAGTEWTLPTGPWHWDSELAENTGPLRRLVIFTFFSEVRPRGGGTLIVSGSHRLLEQFHDALSEKERRSDHRSLRRKFLRWDRWIERLDGRQATPGDRVAYFMEEARSVRGVDLRVEELTGSPGDAILCHPLMLHTTAPNCLDLPRLMRIRFPGR